MGPDRTRNPFDAKMFRCGVAQFGALRALSPAAGTARAIQARHETSNGHETDSALVAVARASRVPTVGFLLTPPQGDCSMTHLIIAKDLLVGSVKKFFGKKEEGASAAEYALLLGLICVAIVAAVGLLANSISNAINKAANVI
jgi:Flp pilus assembly pilin Flp